MGESTAIKGGGWIGGLVVALVAACCYYRTLHPSVAGGDSGELMCVAHELGTPHPPGYPTFAMATKLAEIMLRALFPTMSIAVAHNLFHATLSVVAVVLLYSASLCLTGSIGGAVMGSLLFGFAPNVWTYSVSTEVFPLNNAFMCALMVMVGVYWRQLLADEAAQPLPTLAHALRRRNIVFLASFVCGLSLTNQHTSVLFVSPIALWVFWLERRSFFHKPLHFFICTLLFFAGLMPYLYLPVSSALVVSTNSWGKCNTWSGFWTHFLRKEYGTFSLASKEAEYRVWNAARTWKYFLGDFSDQTMHTVWVLFVLGVVVSLRPLAQAVLAGLRNCFVVEKRVKKPAPTQKTTSSQKGSETVRYFTAELLLVITWVAYCSFFNYFSNLPIDQPLFFGVQQRFWIQPLIIAGVLAARGFHVLVRWLRLPGYAVLSLGLAIGMAQISLNFTEHDESSNFYIRDFGHAILRPLPPNSILLTKGDIMINSARFVQVMEEFRRDVRILDQELLTYEWYNDIVREKFANIVLPARYYHPFHNSSYNMKQFLQKNRQLPSRRVFAAYGFKEGDDSVSGKYVLRPFGTIQEIVPIAESHDIERAPVSADIVRMSPTSLSTGEARRIAYMRELSESLPDLSQHRAPPPGRYSKTSWESVVVGDTVNAFSFISHKLLELGDMYRQHIKEGDSSAASLHANPYYCALENSTKVSKALLGHFPSVPSYIRRNLGVALQGMLAYRPHDTDLIREIHATFSKHLEEVEASVTGGGAARSAELSPIREAIRYYSTLLKQ